MKTVLILHYGGDQVRGSEVCLIHSIDALHEEGYRIVVLRKNACLDEHISGKVDAILDESFPEIMLDGSHRTIPLRKYLASLRRLHGIVRQYRPSVILCNSGLPCQLAVPVGKVLDTPVLCHFHHPAPKRYFYLWLVKYATRLMFPSNYTRENAVSKCGKDGAVIYNAIDVKTRFQPAIEKDGHYRDQLGIDRSRIVVGQVGHLSKHKRPDFLIRSFSSALKQSPGLHLVLVGYGPLYDELQTLIKDTGLQHAVTLTGYVPDVLPYYQHVFDINVLASSVEGLGISVIEASACSVPSIVTDCTGLREVVDHQVTGLAFETDDQGQLTDSILLLARDPDLRRQYAVAARNKAVKTFGLDQYKEKILEQVSSLC